MRSLVLSVSALLTCGFLAFGRPLVTRRERRGLNQKFSLLQNRDRTSADAPYMLSPATPFPALPDPDLNPVSTTSSPVPAITNEEIPLPGTQYTSLLPTLSDEYFKTASASASDLFTPVSPEVGKSEFSTDQYGFGHNLISDTLPTTTRSSSETSPIPASLQQTLQDMMEKKYRHCIYELSLDEKTFLYKECGDEISNWENFSDAVENSDPGFALYRRDDDLVLSIMNLLRECQMNFENGIWTYSRTCWHEEGILSSYKSQWVASVSTVFKHIMSFDRIRLPKTLAEIGHNLPLYEPDPQ